MKYTTPEKVQRLLNYVFGESWGDGEIVTNVIVGCAEPGYRDNDSVIVLGDWNPRHITGVTVNDFNSPLSRWKSDDPRVTFPKRLAESLERMGANIEWSDEWYSCGSCGRAVRSQPNSYQWKPSYLMGEGEICCLDCARDMGEDALDEYVNNPDTVITWCEPSYVESFGYVKWEPGNEHTYENGWHPGQNDNPQSIYDEIVAAHENDVKVVFFLDENSQFYIRFSAYVKEETKEND